MRYSALVTLSLAVTPGCLPLPEEADKQGSPTGDSGDTTQTIQTGPTRGWALIPLLDSEDETGTTLRAGIDMITGIHFSSLDDGVVVTTGGDGNWGLGGAIYKASERELTGVLFDGEALCTSATHFIGLERTDEGYIALAQACDLVESTDGGQSFSVQPAGVGAFGIELALGLNRSGGQTVIVRDTGVVSTTSQVPGTNALWTDVWAPDAIPTIPNPVPADQCQSGPHSVNVPRMLQAAYIGDDLVAYTATTGYEAQICISRDGGESFQPHLLPDVPVDLRHQPPSGVLFTSETSGITWGANSLYPDANYLYRTTDAGESWSPVSLPSEIAGVSIELNQASFAPGGQVGYIVGYDYDRDIALLLKTKDGGESFQVASSGDFVSLAASTGEGKLWSVFALDEQHLWVGGDNGLLLATDDGGE